MVAVRLDQFAAGGHAIQLFDQHAALPAAAKAELANQLLIARALAGGAFNTAEEFAIGHSRYISVIECRRPMSLLILMGQCPANL